MASGPKNAQVKSLSLPLPWLSLESVVALSFFTALDSVIALGSVTALETVVALSSVVPLSSVALCSFMTKSVLGSCFLPNSDRYLFS